MQARERAKVLREWSKAVALHVMACKRKDEAIRLAVAAFYGKGENDRRQGLSKGVNQKGFYQED